MCLKHREPEEQAEISLARSGAGPSQVLRASMHRPLEVRRPDVVPSVI